MLLATAGQTVPYTNNIHGGGGVGVSSSSGAGGSGGVNIVGRANAASNSNSNNNNNNQKLTATVNIQKTPLASATAAAPTTAATINRQRHIQARSSLLLTRLPPQPQGFNSNYSGDYDSYNRPITVTAAASTLMKTLSVRIKDTVQKALFVNVSSRDSAQVASGDSSVKGNLTGGSTNSKINSTSLGVHTVAAVAAASTSTRTSTTAAARGGTAVAYNAQRALAGSSTNASALRRLNLAPSAAFLKLYTVPPTALHRSHEVRQRTTSTDSLLNDVCHFKPIRPMPITGNKSAGGAARLYKIKNISNPQAMRATSANTLLFNFDCDDGNEGKKRGLKKSKRNTAILLKPKQSSTKLQSKIQQSAFVCLAGNVDIKLRAQGSSDIESSNVGTSNITSKRQQAVKKRPSNTSVIPPAKRVRGERTKKNQPKPKSTEVEKLPNDIKKLLAKGSGTRKRKIQTDVVEASNDLMLSEKSRLKDCQALENIKKTKATTLKSKTSAPPPAAAEKNCAIKSTAQSCKRKANDVTLKSSTSNKKQRSMAPPKSTAPPQPARRSPPMTRQRTRLLRISSQQSKQ